MNPSVYQTSIIGTALVGALGAFWIFMNLTLPKTAFSMLILALAISDFGTSLYSIFVMLTSEEELPITDQFFNYVCLDTGFFIALSIALLALKIVKYGYAIESFQWSRILFLCLVPSFLFLSADLLIGNESQLQLMHCMVLTTGFIVLLAAYVITMIELENQKRIRKIAYEKGNIASRLMMRLLMCFRILHILFYLPHLALLWTEYSHDILINQQLDYGFYVYEWIAMSCKGFFHALAICFVLRLKPSKVPPPILKACSDTVSSDTIVLPPKAFDRKWRTPRSPQFVVALPPASPTSSDTVIDQSIEYIK